MTVAFKSEFGKNEIYKSYEQLLTIAGTEHEELTIQTSYGETFILALGNKDLPPLLLLHGSGMNSAMWIKEMELYSKNYRVYAVDIPGEPGKSNENQLPFEGDDFSNWMNDVMAALDIQSTSIVGISLGAWIGAKFSIQYPNKVTKLVLLCPAGLVPLKKFFLFQALFYGVMGEKGLDKLYKKINGDKPLPEIIMSYQKLIGKHFNFRKEGIPLFSDEDLKRLSMPISLFVGAKDIMFDSKKSAARLKSIVSGANINLIDEEGHSIVHQGDAIREFLN